MRLKERAELHEPAVKFDVDGRYHYQMQIAHTFSPSPISILHGPQAIQVSYLGTDVIMKMNKNLATLYSWLEFYSVDLAKFRHFLSSLSFLLNKRSPMIYSTSKNVLTYLYVLA